MRLWKKILIFSILAPIFVVAGNVIYFWATYIDETATSGTAYGFAIGSSKQDALASIRRLDKHPNAVIYVTYGSRAEDFFTVSPLPAHIEQLRQYDQWDVLLDGDGKFFNLVRLTFREGGLAEVYRHRQYFELP